MGLSTDFIIPDSVLAKRASLPLDIVYPQCQHSMCITKAYGRFYNGTGSVVATHVSFRPQIEDAAPGESLQTLSSAENMLAWSGHIRFFSPLEAFRLLGFP